MACCRSLVSPETSPCRHPRPPFPGLRFGQRTARTLNLVVLCWVVCLNLAQSYIRRRSRSRLLLPDDLSLHRWHLLHAAGNFHPLTERVSSTTIIITTFSSSTRPLERRLSIHVTTKSTHVCGYFSCRLQAAKRSANISTCSRFSGSEDDITTGLAI